MGVVRFMVFMCWRVYFTHLPAIVCTKVGPRFVRVKWYHLQFLVHLTHSVKIAFFGTAQGNALQGFASVMLRRRQRRPGSHKSGDRGRSVAIVIWLLSRNIALAGYYVWSMHPDVFSDEENVPDEAKEAAVMCCHV